MVNGVSERRRIGLFGGTFDPIHLGHLIVAVEVRYALDLDLILFVPAGQPPHKPDQPISSDIDRVNMLELAIAGLPGFDVSTVDLDRPGPSYTADTLEHVALEYPDDRRFFIMGADSLRDLADWHAPERIVRAAELAVAARPGVDLDLREIELRIPDLAGRVHMVETPLIGISATDIRRRVAGGEPITFQVPRDVEAYIHEHRLYRPTDAPRAPIPRERV